MRKQAQQEAVAQVMQQAVRAAPEPSAEVVEGRSSGLIEDDLEAQVAEFIFPPAPDRTVGEWTLIGPVRGEYGTYFRAVTNDAMETESRMSANLLLLDYDQYTMDAPSMTIAVEYLTSLEEAMSGFMGVEMFDIHVDGRKVGRIEFHVRPSGHQQYILLEQAESSSPKNVHSMMLTGQRVSFIGDNDERFDFDINGLAGLEEMF